MHDYKLALMTGIDIPIIECGLTLHQPTLIDIAYIGETAYLVGSQCLTISKTLMIEDESLLANITNFQLLMTVMTSPESKDQRESVLTLLQVLFPNYKITVAPRSIIFSKPENVPVVIDENNFEIIQNTFKEVFCYATGPMDQSSFNPGDARSREIAQKLMRGRQRVAAQQGMGGTNGGSIFSRYISILSIGAHIDIAHIMKLTPYQLYDLIERYFLYTNWDIDIRTRLAGGNPETRPDDWMKNIH